jgi:hypothetical protein
MSAIQSTTSAQDLARSLLKTFESNGAGTTATPDDFGAFLTRLLSGVTSASAAATATSASSTTNTGVKFEGFDLAVPRDPAKSAKYSFAYAAKAAGTMPTSKADAEAWFNTNIKSRMIADGHTINWVKGGQFQFTDNSGTFVVDYLRPADGGSAVLTWQPQ